MMRPVILSRPEKVAFLFTIFWAGGSVTTSSPGCRLGGVCGTAPAGAPFCLRWGGPGGRARGVGRGDRDGGRLVWRSDRGARRRRQRLALDRSRHHIALPALRR